MSEPSVKQLTGDDVRTLRNKTGMTQKQFCEFFGFNINTLRHWERGDRSPSGAALSILNLLSTSPELFRELKSRESARKDSSEGKAILKNIVVKPERKSLKLLLEKYPDDIEAIILVLLKSIGFVYQKTERESGLIVFYAGHDVGNLKSTLCLSAAKNEVSGEYLPVLEKALSVIYAIENDLSSALYMPHEMRQSRVQAVIQDLGTDEAFFSTVLRNW